MCNLCALSSSFQVGLVIALFFLISEIRFYKWFKFQGNVNQIGVVFFFIWRKVFYQFLQINSSIFSLTVPVCKAGHDNVLDCLDVKTVSLCFLKRHHQL